MHAVATTVLMWPTWTLIASLMILGGFAAFVLHYPFDALSDWLSKRFKEKRSDMAGHFLGVVGVMYAVVLGLVVVTAWQQYDHTEEVWMREQEDTSNLFDLFSQGEHTSAAQRALRVLLRDYARGMEGEWAQMRYGELLCADTKFESELSASCQPSRGAQLPASRLNSDLMLKIRDRATALFPELGPPQSGIVQTASSLVADFAENRDHRRHHYAEAPVQATLWLAFFIGGLIAVAVTYLAEEKSINQCVRATALGAMIGIMFGVALVFDHPFTGSSGIPGDRWCMLVNHFDFQLNPSSVKSETCLSR